MSTVKLTDIKMPCLSPDHLPPSHMVFSPGEYENTCSSCGNKTIFTVPLIIS